MLNLEKGAEKSPEKEQNRVIFLDRDGTMNVEVNYLHRPEDLKLIPGTAEAVKRFNEAGYRVIVVTNQAGIGRGYYTENDVENLHRYMNGLLERQGAHVDAFYFCPHHPEHGIGEYRKVCHCRKPEIGMFEAALNELGGELDREHSFMIGDKLIDTQAGHNFGIRSILVGTGYGKEIRDSGMQAEQYDYYAEDLLHAAEAILEGKIVR